MRRFLAPLTRLTPLTLVVLLAAPVASASCGGGADASGPTKKVNVSGVEVIAARTADKIVFVWFGDSLFEVLQIKGVGIDPQSMLKGILDFQRPTGQLRIRTTKSR